MRPIWSPNPASVNTAWSTQFARQLELKDPSYPYLHNWSIHHLDEFWSTLWDSCGVRGTKGKDILCHQDGQDFYHARWFPQARLNYSDNMLSLVASPAAIAFISEAGERIEWSRQQLIEEVLACAAALIACGINKGDVVAGYLPNIPHTIICMLACGWIGAIWSSCSPDFGVTGVVDRFGQIKPRLLFTSRHYHYKGRQYDIQSRIDTITSQLPQLERTVYVAVTDDEPSWHDFIKLGKDKPPAAMLPFDHPLVIMFSSGTTGKPKCIVHSHGGVLLKHLSEHKLNINLSDTDRFFYFTTCGWMMWNWMVSGLLSGAQLILYDGNPFYPTAGRLVELWQDEQVTVAGVSAKLLEGLAKAGVKTHGKQLDKLRMICSTGSPLSVHGFEYVYQHLSQDLCLASISGGTDIIGCFVSGTPTLPVYAGQIQVAAPAMAVAIYDENGQTVEGQKGELVCRQPFPSVPVQFWGDDSQHSAMKKAYFSQFDGVWTQSDYAERTVQGGYIIYGRSDTTLNPGGVRIGTGEIYRVLEPLDELIESLVVEQQWQGSSRLVLFVVINDNSQLDEVLKTKICQCLKQDLSPRHVPAKIIAVPELPRTVSGKISEMAVRDCINNQPPTNTGALANPDALNYFINIAELSH